ncbi:VWA domain-containing protein [Dokdonia sp. Asnod1-B02]|uniref:VWA domain-containing protein n=1 Tax=Dokdonia sp. Asnod1-B02 TaxID=3160573 RepID=UPI00386C5AA6
MQTETLLLIIGAAILALGIAVFQYFYKAKYKTSRNKVYALIRFLSVFGLLILLINPSYKQVTYVTVKPSLAVAVDNTASIKHLEYDDESSDLVSRFRESEPLNNAFDVEFYSFGQEFKRLDTLDFQEKQTNISNVLYSLEDIYGTEIAPVILLTDGNQTYGEAYQYTSKNLNQQIYPVVLGDTITYDDLKLGQVNVNKYAYINNKFPVEIFASYNGNNTVSSQLTVTSGGTVVHSERVTFSPDKESQVFNLLLPATSVGVRQYAIQLAPSTTEKNIKNNSKNFAIEVIDQKTNVLIVSNIVHPDVGMLKKSIESNRLRTVTFSNPLESLSKLNDYELVILYQPDARFKNVYEQLISLSKNSITVAGANTDWNAVNTFQNTINQEITGQQEEVQGELNVNFSAFVIEDIGFADFPPLKTSFGDVNFKTEVDVALTQTIGSLNTENPLIATTDTNGQREVYILGEGLWRWRAQSFINNNSFEDFDNFIDNLVQYAASNKKKSRLNIDYESFYYGNGDVTLYAQYFDKNYTFDTRARLSIRVVHEETGKVTDIPLLLNKNTYQVAMNNLEPGNYKFTVSVIDQGLARSGSFTIVPFEIEQQFLNANVTELRTLASNTAAALYTSATGDQLIEDLLKDTRYKPVQKSTEKIVPLIDWKWLLFIIALLLSIEWFMRKYNGLT